MIETRIVAETDGGPMSARVWRPDGDGPFPVVLCYHHGPGIGAEIFAVARRFAEEGYYAVAPDLYHRYGEEISFDMAELWNEASAERARFNGIIEATTAEIMVADSVALLSAIREDAAASAGPAGCIGFCHTARTVIRAMADHPDLFAAGAIIHPAFTVTDQPNSSHLAVPNIVGEIYSGFGAVDRVSPVTEQEPLITALNGLGDRSTLDIHPDGDHGYFFPGSPLFDPEGTAVAWMKTLEIFDRRLKAAATTM